MAIVHCRYGKDHGDDGIDLGDRQAHQRWNAYAETTQ
jgi:hypothetical protein